eukprot:1766293-Rhodomonas_salina.2
MPGKDSLGAEYRAPHRDRINGQLGKSPPFKMGFSDGSGPVHSMARHAVGTQSASCSGLLRFRDAVERRKGMERGPGEGRGM